MDRIQITSCALYTEIGLALMPNTTGVKKTVQFLDCTVGIETLDIIVFLSSELVYPSDRAGNTVVHAARGRGVEW